MTSGDHIPRIEYTAEETKLWWVDLEHDLVHFWYVWQSQVEIKHYSVAYFNHITAFEAL